jgi:hypothetical protein
MSVEPAGERARQIPYMLGSQSKVIGLTSTAASIMDDKILLLWARNFFLISINIFKTV